MMSFFLATVLVLAPVLEDDTVLRVVSVGTGAEDVVWYLDGHEVARTRDGEASTFAAPAGRHELHAVTAYEGEWQVLARPDPRHADGAAYVPAWTARHDPAEPGRAPEAPRLPPWTFPVALAIGGAVFALWPEGRRTKGP